MTIAEKFKILTEGAKYDVSCSSSGANRGSVRGKHGLTNVGGAVSYTHLDVYKRQVMCRFFCRKRSKERTGTNGIDRSNPRFVCRAESYPCQSRATNDGI